MKQEISQKKKGVDFGGYDSIVIKKHITDIEGGRTLDMTGYPENVLYAAHVIISTEAEGVKTYKPMPVVAKNTDVYTKVADTTGKNPYTEGWYKSDGQGGYVAVTSTETTPVEGTDYYVKTTEPQKDEDGAQVYGYDSLPAGASYEGVLYRSIAKDKPAASILIDGVVNDKVMKIELGAIESAFKAACPHIIFKHDEEA